MAPKLAPAPLVTGVDNRARRHMTAIAGGADGATQIVVVGQLIGQDGETAHLVQHFAAQRHGRAKTGVGHAQTQPGQNIGEKLIVDAHGRQPRPQGAGRRACVKACHKSDRGIGERGDDFVKVGGADPDIAVRQHHDLASDGGLHIDEVADLAVLAVQTVIDDQRNIQGGIGALKVPHDPYGLVADIMDAAYDLNPTGIVLETKTFQVGVKPRLRAMEGFQDCNKWLLRLGRTQISPPKVALDLPACKDSVSGADESESQEGPAEQNQHVSPLPCRLGRRFGPSNDLIIRRGNR